MNKDEALKMAIEALQNNQVYDCEGKPMLAIEEANEKAIQACKEALEQPAQEPVAWIEYLWVENEDDGKLYPETRLYDYPSDDAQPLYTHPAPSCSCKDKK